MIEINPQLCMLIVELLCGGNEAQILKNEDVEKKSFTDIEIAILEEILKLLYLLLKMLGKRLQTLKVNWIV